MTDSLKNDLAVVYLARGIDGGVAKARAFFEAYDRHPAGCEHDLVVIVKGWGAELGLDTVLSMTESRGGNVLELPDDGFDIGAYFRVAGQLPYEWFFFMNSHSRPEKNQWLSIVQKAAQSSGVGAVSCTGSWATRNLGAYPLIVHIHLSNHWLLGIKSYLKTRVKPHEIDMPMYPNPHLRTNAFMISRKLWLEFALQFGIPTSKEECYDIEHGKKSLTRFLDERKLLPIVTGADGVLYPPALWNRSKTSYSPGLANLLVCDNESERYTAADPEVRRKLEIESFGKPKSRDFVLQRVKTFPLLYGELKKLAIKLILRMSKQKEKRKHK